MKHPNNCKKCGGKMQIGGLIPKQSDYPDNESLQNSIDEWLINSQPSFDLNFPQQSAIKEEDIIPGINAPLPEPTKIDYKNNLEEAISKGVIDSPRENMSSKEWYNYINTPSDKKRHPSTPKGWNQNLGIGMMGVTSLLSEISGKVARGRQNQYDYLQQTALGMMNPMPATDYQPNPYSLYAKYGGSLKKYQQGGRTPIVTDNPNDPRLRAYKDSLSLYDGSIRSLKWAQKEFAPYADNGTTPMYIEYNNKDKKDILKYVMSNGQSNLSDKLRLIFNMPDLEKKTILKTGILPIGSMQNIDYSGGHGYSISKYKKPVQPVVYQKPQQIMKAPPTGTNYYGDSGDGIKKAEFTLKKKPADIAPQLQEPKFLKPSAIPREQANLSTGQINPNIPAPNMQRVEWDMSKPSSWTITSPTGPYNEHETMNFPDEASWRAAMENYKNISSQQMDGKGTATGYKKMKYGGLQHVNYFGPPFSNGAKMDFTNGQRLDMRKVRRIVDDMLKMKGGGLTPNKAREILHDGTAQGKPLTDKQRRFFGAKSKGHTNYRGK